MQLHAQALSVRQSSFMLMNMATLTALTHLVINIAELLLHRLLHPSETRHHGRATEWYQ